MGGYIRGSKYLIRCKGCGDATSTKTTDADSIKAKGLCGLCADNQIDYDDEVQLGFQNYSDSENKAAEILNDALAAMSERGQSYDTTGDGKERSMAKVVEMFNTLTGANLTTEQGWDFMILLKLVRASQGYKNDNYLDGSAYFALAGEAAAEANK